MAVGRPRSGLASTREHDPQRAPANEASTIARRRSGHTLAGTIVEHGHYAARRGRSRGAMLMQRGHTARQTACRSGTTGCRLLSSPMMKRRPERMTKRKRDRMIDVALAGLVILACLGSAAVTLAI